MKKRDIAVYAITYLEEKIKYLKKELRQQGENFKIRLEIAKHEQELKDLYKMF